MVRADTYLKEATPPFGHRTTPKTSRCPRVPPDTWRRDPRGLQCAWSWSSAPPGEPGGWTLHHADEAGWAAGFSGHLGTMYPRTGAPERPGVQFPPCILANLTASPSRLRQDFLRLPPARQLLSVPSGAARLVSEEGAQNALPLLRPQTGKTWALLPLTLQKPRFRKASTCFHLLNISVATQVWSSPSPNSPSFSITSF